MSLADKIAVLYQEMCSSYPGGVSNTSTAKFGDFESLFKELFSLEDDEVYIVGAGTRPTNLPIRFSQGRQATKHTKLGVGFVVSDGKKSLDSLIESSSTTLNNYAARGRTHYDSIVLIVIDDNEKPLVARMFKYADHSDFDALFSRNFPSADIVEVKVTPDVGESETPSSYVVGTNRIYFGPPGTGKSTRVKDEISGRPYV